MSGRFRWDWSWQWMVLIHRTRTDVRHRGLARKLARRRVRLGL
ncbi:MAG: hypothetical protein ACH37Z_12255 [Anaerolineae bacterium]